MAVKEISAPVISQWRFAFKVISLTFAICVGILGSYWAYSEANHFLMVDSRFLLAVPDPGEDPKSILMDGVKHSSRQRIAHEFANDFGRSIYNIPIAAWNVGSSIVTEAVLKPGDKLRTCAASYHSEFKKASGGWQASLVVAAGAFDCAGGVIGDGLSAPANVIKGSIHAPIDSAKSEQFVSTETAEAATNISDGLVDTGFALHDMASIRGARDKVTVAKAGLKKNYATIVEKQITLPQPTKSSIYRNAKSSIIENMRSGKEGVKEVRASKPKLEAFKTLLESGVKLFFGEPKK